jgi:L-fuconolactonase
VIGAFGLKHSFWGNDLSRMLTHCGYRQGVTHFTEALDFLSAEDLAWIMSRGLRECLRWEPAQR